MPLVIEMGVGELAATRFAVSALGETVTGLQLLAWGKPAPAVRRWHTWARARLRDSGLALPLAGPLVAGGAASFPQFLLPSPDEPQPALHTELLHMRGTRAAQVRASFERVWGADQPAAARLIAAAPAAGLRAVAAELQAAHDLLIAPHWPRMRAVLLGDVAYRAGRLATGGTDRLFADLHPEVQWSSGRLALTRFPDTRAMTLGERGLVLVPSVLLHGSVQIKRHTTTQTTLRYPARGCAELWSDRSEPRSAVVDLLGRPRARILAAASTPTTTSVLAGQFGVTPSAVSQHLAVLRAAGLVRSDRAGRSVVHLTTDRGLALLHDTGVDTGLDS